MHDGFRFRIGLFLFWWRGIRRKKIFGRIRIILLLRRIDKANSLAKSAHQRADSVTTTEISGAVRIRLARSTVCALLLDGNCLLGLPLLGQSLLYKQFEVGHCLLGVQGPSGIVRNLGGLLISAIVEDLAPILLTLHLLVISIRCLLHIYGLRLEQCSAWLGALDAALVTALIAGRAPDGFLACFAPLAIAPRVAEASAAETDALTTVENAPAVVRLIALGTHASQLSLRFGLL